jgi:hypothetical protein
MRILFVGLGNLGSQVFDLFVLRAQRGDQFLVVRTLIFDFDRSLDPWWPMLLFQAACSCLPRPVTSL